MPAVTRRKNARRYSRRVVSLLEGDKRSVFNRCLEEVFYVLCSGSSMGVNLFVASLYPRLIKRVLKFKKSEKFLQTQKNGMIKA